MLDRRLVVAADHVLAPRAEARLEDDRRLELGRRQPRRDVHGARMRDAGARQRRRRSRACRAPRPACADRSARSRRTRRGARAPRAPARPRRATAGRRAGRARRRRAAGASRAWAGETTGPSRVFVGRDTVGDDGKGAHLRECWGRAHQTGRGCGQAAPRLLPLRNPCPAPAVVGWRSARRRALHP